MCCHSTFCEISLSLPFAHIDHGRADDSTKETTDRPREYQQTGASGSKTSDERRDLRNEVKCLEKSIKLIRHFPAQSNGNWFWMRQIRRLRYRRVADRRWNLVRHDANFHRSTVNGHWQNGSQLFRGRIPSLNMSAALRRFAEDNRWCFVYNTIPEGPDWQLRQRSSGKLQISIGSSVFRRSVDKIQCSFSHALS